MMGQLSFSRLISTLVQVGVCRSQMPMTLIAHLVGFCLALGLVAGAPSCSSNDPLIPSTGRTWYVKPDSTGDAPTVQAAIDSAQAGDVVLLAEGTYTWTSQGASGHSMILMKAGLSLRSESGPELTILDGEDQGRVILCLGVGDVVIEGLTIQEGRGLGPSEEPFFVYGGGIFSDENSNPTISLCIFRKNSTPFRGGAIFCTNATITNCQFIENTAWVEGDGAGIWSRGEVNVIGCLFAGNRSDGDASPSAAGMRAFRASVRDCRFENNLARGFQSASAGAVAIGGGSISKSTFIGNRAAASTDSPFGGAVNVGGIVTISDCVFADNSAFGRDSPGAGGAIGSSGLLPLTVVRCTLVRNRATGPDDPFGARPIGGVAAANATVISTVIAWTEGLAVNTIDSTSCCNFYGNSHGDTVRGIEMGGNFSADPRFCGADSLAGIDFGLRADSPCAEGNHPNQTSCGRIGASAVGCQNRKLQRTFRNHAPRGRRRRGTGHETESKEDERCFTCPSASCLVRRSRRRAGATPLCRSRARSDLALGDSGR